MKNLENLIEKIKISTLSEKAKDILISMLADLADWQLIDIEKSMDTDIKKQEIAFKKAELQASIIRDNFKKDLDALIKKEQEKTRKDKLRTLRKWVWRSKATT